MLALTKGIVSLTALLMFLFPWSWFNNDVNIKVNSWDGKNQYQGTLNNKPVVIYVDMEDEANTPEYHPKPGKIKIIYKDSKQTGTTLIYERNMEDGEISDQDQVYIEKILESVEKFHRENKSYLNVKEKLNSLWREVSSKRKRR